MFNRPTAEDGIKAMSNLGASQHQVKLAAVAKAPSIPGYEVTGVQAEIGFEEDDDMFILGSIKHDLIIKLVGAGFAVKLQSR